MTSFFTVIICPTPTMMMRHPSDAMSDILALPHWVEQWPTESKSVVLPLHQESKSALSPNTAQPYRPCRSTLDRGAFVAWASPCNPRPCRDHILCAYYNASFRKHSRLRRGRIGASDRIRTYTSPLLRRVRLPVALQKHLLRGLGSHTLPRLLCFLLWHSHREKGEACAVSL